jgi:hypothetical protein
MQGICFKPWGQARKSLLDMFGRLKDEGEDSSRVARLEIPSRLLLRFKVGFDV